MNHNKANIVRRHKCEVCHTIYECEDCTEYAEKYMVNYRGNNRKGNGVFTAPDCMKKFVCEVCKDAKG